MEVRDAAETVVVANIMRHGLDESIDDLHQALLNPPDHSDTALRNKFLARVRTGMRTVGQLKLSPMEVKRNEDGTFKRTDVEAAYRQFKRGYLYCLEDLGPPGGSSTADDDGSGSLR